jgi:stress-induced morphogen
MPTADELIGKLSSSELEPSLVNVTDDSDGCGSKFNAIIVSSKFEGVGLLDRQRMVNDLIADEMKVIHAFTMKTWTYTCAASNRTCIFRCGCAHFCLGSAAQAGAI